MRIPSLKQPVARLASLATTNSAVLVGVTAGNMALRMVSSVFLTRLLMPEAFGIVGIIGSIFFIVYMITDLGFTSYIVRDERGDDPHFLNVLWTLHALRGVVLMVVGISLAPLLAIILDKPELTWPAIGAMTTLAISGLQSFGSITALRHDGAKRIALFDLGATAVQVVVNIILAFWLRSVWSLIISMIVQSAAKTLLSFCVFDGPRPRFIRDDVITREFLKFSKLVASSSVITLLMAQTDKLVLARLFTLAEFGIYGIALTLASAATALGETYISRIVFPKYTKAARQNDAPPFTQFYALRRSQSLVFALLCGGMIGSAHLIVAILYDPRYIGAAAYLSILTIGSLFRMPSVAAAEYIMAFGSYSGWLNSNIVRLSWVIAVGCLGFLVFGPTGIVVAVATAECAAWVYLSSRLRKLGVFEAREELLFVATALIGIAAGYGVSALVNLAKPTL